MSVRDKGEGRVYLRKSSARQELSLEMQLEWAIAEAKSHNVHLDASLQDLQHMQASGLSHFRAIFLDDAVSGADMKRQGLNQFVGEIRTNPSVSHVFIHERDRLGRPKNDLNLLDHMVIETGILRCGVTIVLSDETVTPTPDGEANLNHLVKMLFNYHESGEFLMKLAERIIMSQRHLASSGYRTGGNPPYGFARHLVNEQGEVLEELAEGRVVRQPGCHVIIKPKDKFKIGVWLYIIELKAKGWGFKRIAAHLNQLGIPSPGAGRQRTDQRVKHHVSGKWCAGTVADLCRNPAIAGYQHYGRRSEGKHRRLDRDGPRSLNDHDRITEERTRVVENEEQVQIKAPLKCGSQIDPQTWLEIQDRIAERGKNQRGIPRSKDPAKYPLSGHVFDLTEGCGWPMYGMPSGNRLLYKCGRYSRTNGAECFHNKVDAEAMLRLTLTTFVQLARELGGRDKLQVALLEHAHNTANEPKTSTNLRVDHLQSTVSVLQTDVATIANRMATEKNEIRYQAIAREFDRMSAELEIKKAELERRRANLATEKSWNPEVEVEAALSLFDEIERVAQCRQARADIPLLLERLGVLIGLNFGEGIKGKKRPIRQLLGGVITFGNTPLPVPIYGKDSLSDNESPTGTTFENGDPEAKPAGEKQESQREGNSFTKGGRGDWI